ESNRTPFDVPEGESEIVAGHMTEYSGFKYATFFMAEYLGMFAVSGLAVTLFLGGWHAPVRVLEIVPSYVWFFLKLSALLFVYIWLRATLPRMRVDQMMNVAWNFMLGAEFVGLALVFIYIGAVAVLIVFTILLTRRDPKEHYGLNWSGVLIALAVFAGLTLAVLKTQSLSVVPPHIRALTVKQIGQ